MCKRTLTIVFLFTLLTSKSHASDWQYFCKADSKIYSSAVELTKGEKRVLLVGYNHYSSKDYFQRQYEMMKEWIGSDRATILTELMTCEEQTEMIIHEANISNEQLQRVVDFASGLSEREPDFLDDFLTSTACRPDIDEHNTLRPSYIVDRNQNLCGHYESLGLGCQWNSPLPDEDNIRQRSGDLRINEYSRSLSLIGSMPYRSGYWPKIENDKLWKEAFNLWAANTRDQNLFKEILFELNDTNKVVAPWGGAHLVGLVKLLESSGFKLEPTVFHNPTIDFNDSRYPEGDLEFYRKDILPELKDCPSNIKN